MGPQSLLELPATVSSGSEPVVRTPEPALWGALSADDLRARANELAAALREYGLEAGQCVAILAKASPDTTVALLAAVRAGATALLLDPALSGNELVAILESRNAVQAVAGDETRMREILARRADLPGLELVLVARPDPSERPIPALRVEAACQAGAAVLDRYPVTSKLEAAVEPALEVVGSGGTGKTWSHAALLLAAERLATALSLGTRDVVLSRLPVVHDDFAPLLAACLARGARLVFDAREPFSLGTLLECGATVAAVRPSDLTSLRRGIDASGAAKSWGGRRLHAWALAQGRDRERHPRRHWLAEVLVLRNLRNAAGPSLRLIQVLGGSADAETTTILNGVGFPVAGPPEGAA